MVITATDVSSKATLKVLLPKIMTPIGAHEKSIVKIPILEQVLSLDKERVVPALGKDFEAEERNLYQN